MRLWLPDRYLTTTNACGVDEQRKLDAHESASLVQNSFSIALRTTSVRLTCLYKTSLLPGYSRRAQKRSPQNSLYMAAEQYASAVARHASDQITVDEVSGIPHGGTRDFANDHRIKLLKSTTSELLSKQTLSKRHSNHLKPGYHQLEFIHPRSRLRERPPVPFAQRGDICPAQR